MNKADQVLNQIKATRSKVEKALKEISKAKEEIKSFLPSNYKRPRTDNENKNEDRVNKWMEKVEGQHFKWGEPEVERKEYYRDNLNSLNN